jgi:hypothetical protein
MSKRKPNWTDREKVVLLEEYEKRKVILKAKFSSSITSGDRNMACCFALKGACEL